MRNFDNQTILIGDVNLPEINWSDQTTAGRGREVLTTAQTENLEQLVDFPTHIKGNTLDLVLTNCSERFISISNGGRIGKSDHCILNMEVKIDFVKRNDKAKRPNWTKADFAGLRGFLGNIDWNRILTDRPVEEAWTTFRSTLDLALAKFVPNSTVRNENTPKWLTREIVKLVRRKKRAWKLTQTHGTTENFNKYKSLEKEVTFRLRNAKRSMEKRLANSGNNNARTFANYLKSKTKSRTGVGPLKDTDGSLITDDKKISEKLNKFFASVFTIEDNSSIPKRPLETATSLDNVVFTKNKIREKINGLKATSAPGPDGISAHLLQSAKEELLEPLQIIYQKTLLSGEVPRVWKHATVTPIFKKGTKGDPANYRPVSLTSIPCKLFESILKDNIMQHLLDNNLIKDSQHGFMPGRSCTTNLVIFLDKLTEILDQGKQADVFYLDFTKAFDKVPGARLLQKMKNKGIGGHILNWIENWLTGRTQSVKVGKEMSNNCEVK